MASSNKTGPGFWSMGSTVTPRPSKPAISTYDALLAKAQSRLKGGDLPGARALAEQAVEHSDNPKSRLALAAVCLAARDFPRAEANYKEVLLREPGNFKALLGYGQLKLGTGQPEPAIVALEAAVAVEPRSIDARHLLARSYGLGDRLEDALKLFGSLVKEAPRNADIWSGYGRALANQGAAERAIEAYHRALELKPEDDAIHQGLGAAYLSIGQLEKAEQFLKRATRLNPGRGAPLRRLAKISHLDPNSLAEAKLQLGRLSADDPKRHSFLLAIAAIAEREGNYEEAFRAISESMALGAARARIKYVPDVITRMADKLISLAGSCPRHTLPSSPLRPIFLIGMPRSGSTLAEQILARHPSVFAAGEWPATKKTAAAMERTGKPYPEGVPLLTAAEASELRSIYFADLPVQDVGKTVLTDKLLGNVFYLPLIETLFSDAGIVRCRRHPMDSLWSIMTQGFTSSVPFAKKTEDICHHMLQQHRILSAWTERGSVPMVDLYYEELVERFEAGAHALVEFAHLPWDDACLRPQDSSRAVLTASAGQVHRPVSKASVGRWRPFGPHLEQAVATLKPLIELHEAELAKRGISY